MPTLQRRLLLSGSGGLVTAGLAALWMPALDYFSGITAPTVTDRSGHGNTLTLGSTSGVDANDPAWSQQGLLCNGTSQYAGATMALDCTKPFSILAVANGVNLVQQTCVSVAQGTTGKGLLQHYQTNSGRWYDGTDRSGGSLDTNSHLLSISSMPGIAGLLCIDGVVISTAATASLTGINTVYVGASAGTSGWWNGTISAVAIYNRALSAAEVQRNYRWLRVQLAPAGVTLP